MFSQLPLMWRTSSRRKPPSIYFPTFDDSFPVLADLRQLLPWTRRSPATCPGPRRSPPHLLRPLQTFDRSHNLLSVSVRGVLDPNSSSSALFDIFKVIGLLLEPRSSLFSIIWFCQNSVGLLKLCQILFGSLLKLYYSLIWWWSQIFCGYLYFIVLLWRRIDW